jgi:thymidylate synthase-like protein
VESGVRPRAESRQEVRLVYSDPEAEARVIAALIYPFGSADAAAAISWARALPPEERKRIVTDLASLRKNRRHKPPRALEWAEYTFDLVGDFGMYRDLHRHRMLSQQRQLLTTDHGYEVPEEVRDAGQSQPYQAAMEQARQTFEIVRADFPEQAQYAVPMAYRIRWCMHINLRALVWLAELRSQPQGHPAYRRMAQHLYRLASTAHPGLAGWFRFVDMEDHDLGRLEAEQRHEAARMRG